MDSDNTENYNDNYNTEDSYNNDNYNNTNTTEGSYYNNNNLEDYIVDKVMINYECVEFEAINKLIYICVYIENYSHYNDLVLMGSNDNKNFFDYKYLRYKYNNEKVFKIKNIFEYYKIINKGGLLKTKILIFSK
jgi:hypothetical protein